MSQGLSAKIVLAMRRNELSSSMLNFSYAMGVFEYLGTFSCDVFGTRRLGHTEAGRVGGWAGDKQQWDLR